LKTIDLAFLRKLLYTPTLSKPCRAASLPSIDLV